ncbi:MAG: N-formylglutamate amidohydrolase [Desulfobacterales bacterium]|nr:N-formylglutamate amidohydrolase [Desulfobacterales bacterium]
MNEAKIIFPYSRLFCDVERLIDDPLEKIGRGIIYSKLLNGSNFIHNFPKEEALRLYKDHHHKFELEIYQTVSLYHVLIVDCHSFNNEPLPYEKNRRKRPDFCISVDEKHTPKKLVDDIINTIRNSNLSVEINFPYEGTIIPSYFYGKANEVSSIMIEVNKKLYLTKDFKKSKSYNKTKKIIEKILYYTQKFENDL